MTRRTMRAVGRAAALTLTFLVGLFIQPAAAVTVPGDYSSIQAAVNAVVAGVLPDGTTIDVQPGTFFETLAVVNTNRSFTVIGVGGAAATVVDAVGKGASAVYMYRATGRI